MPGLAGAVGRLFDDILEAEPRDFFDFGQSRGPFLDGRIAQPDLHCLKNGSPVVQPGTDHKWKSESLAIGLVSPREFGQFRGRQPVQPGERLFLRRLGCQAAGLRQPSRQVRMRPNQCKLPLDRRTPQGRAQFRMKKARIAEWTPIEGLLGDPRRILEYSAEGPDEGRPVVGVYLSDRRHGCPVQ